MRFTLRTMRIEQPKNRLTDRRKINWLTIVPKVIVPKVEEYRAVAVCPIAQKWVFVRSQCVRQRFVFDF